MKRMKLSKMKTNNISIACNSSRFNLTLVKKMMMKKSYSMQHEDSEDYRNGVFF